MQPGIMSGNIPQKKPRICRYADEPGAYSLVVESSQPLAYKGDTILLKLFFSGYGMISSPKLFIVMPPRLHNPEKSYIYMNIYPDKNDGFIKFGNTKEPLHNITSYSIRGMKAPAWDEPTLMIDVDGRPNMIFTEMVFTRAPFEMEININQTSFKEYFLNKERLRAGQHPIKFVLTYFNGRDWITEQTVHDITLSSWYQRHELLAWFIGTIVALIALVATTIGTIAGVVSIFK